VDAVYIVLVLHEHGVGLEQNGGFLAIFLPAAGGQRLQLGDSGLLCLSQAGLFGGGVGRLCFDYGGILTLEGVQRPLDHAFGYALSLH